MFLEFLAGRVRAADVLAHPAYRTIQAHAELFGDGLDEQDIEAAAQGRPSPFYGLRDLAARREKIARLAGVLRERREEWLAQAAAALGRLLPGEDLSGITIYPLLGYDMGIGLQGAVCMNLNHTPYLEQPEEFLCYLIHECVHVVYERHHRVLPLQAVNTPAEWLDCFGLFLHNEGFAVYTPWDLRRARGLLDDGDYRALEDAPRMAAICADFQSAWRALGAAEGWTREQYLEQVFGDRRLTYRAGAYFIRRVEEKYGMEAVRRAFFLSGREFVEQYRIG